MTFFLFFRPSERMHCGNQEPTRDFLPLLEVVFAMFTRVNLEILLLECCLATRSARTPRACTTFQGIQGGKVIVHCTIQILYLVQELCFEASGLCRLGVVMQRLFAWDSRKWQGSLKVSSRDFIPRKIAESPLCYLNHRCTSLKHTLLLFPVFLPFVPIHNKMMWIIHCHFVCSVHFAQALVCIVYSRSEICLQLLLEVHYYITTNGWQTLFPYWSACALCLRVVFQRRFQCVKKFGTWRGSEKTKADVREITSLASSSGAFRVMLTTLRTLDARSANWITLQILVHGAWASESPSTFVCQQPIVHICVADKCPNFRRKELLQKN